MRISSVFRAALSTYPSSAGLYISVISGVFMSFRAVSYYSLMVLSVSNGIPVIIDVIAPVKVT